MAERITKTNYIYMYNKIVASYISPKKDLSVSKKNIIEFYNNISKFYKDEIDLYHKKIEAKENKVIAYNTTYEKIWRYFYINIPVNDIDDLAMNINYDSPVKKNDEKHEKYVKDLLQQINFNPIRFNDSEYQNMVISYNKILGYVGYLIADHMVTDPDHIKEFVILDAYIKFLPILKLSHILYFNIFFMRYLQKIYLVKPQHIRFASYQFIKKHFHFECTNQNDVIRIMFFKCFENLKKNKQFHFYPLSYNNKQCLYKFIIYLKTYYKITKSNSLEFNDKGYLIQEEYNELLTIFYHRESKKYYHKFFGKHADFKKYLSSLNVNEDH